MSIRYLKEGDLTYNAGAYVLDITLFDPLLQCFSAQLFPELLLNPSLALTKDSTTKILAAPVCFHDIDEKPDDGRCWLASSLAAGIQGVMIQHPLYIIR
ncbi:hypothetical protein Nepgr_007775 [Nepenthes gracilis]|uniref:Uncharacterized protein n=1 Tax=Nepenthes gracilis TaxID=150966 RepID=A0AAD3S7G9_NEPGR|nr:hypothetical protein Nepgr_007775 [Nepenthes gracilis]